MASRMVGPLAAGSVTCDSGESQCSLYGVGRRRAGGEDHQSRRNGYWADCQETQHPTLKAGCRVSGCAYGDFPKSCHSQIEAGGANPLPEESQTTEETGMAAPRGSAEQAEKDC